MQKPTTESEYVKWMSENASIKFDSRTQHHYEAVVNKVHPEFQECVFWKELGTKLKEYDEAYTLLMKYPLLLRTSPPELLKKPYTSFVDKTFRKNIVLNRRFPKPPKSGWLAPDAWFDRLGDAIRTSLVVKYLDGVDYLVNELDHLAKKHNLNSDTYFESRDEGYYAAHFYIDYPVTVPDVQWNSLDTSIRIEIQITTQLQEVIRKLLHSYYEKRRSKVPDSNIRKWQWNYRDEEFGANYLGHILHYLEGMIVDIREKRDK